GIVCNQRSETPLSLAVFQREIGLADFECAVTISPSPLGIPDIERRCAERQSGAIERPFNVACDPGRQARHGEPRCVVRRTERNVERANREITWPREASCACPDANRRGAQRSRKVERGRARCYSHSGGIASQD